MKAIILIMILFGVVLIIAGGTMSFFGFWVADFNPVLLMTGVLTFMSGVGLLIVSVHWTKNREIEEKKDKNDNSFKILRERYAKEEITKEEFEQKKKDLENS